MTLARFFVVAVLLCASVVAEAADPVITSAEHSFRVVIVTRGLELSLIHI